MSYTRDFLWLCAILLIKGLAILLFVLYGGVGLGPDEAQYWTWSRDLALGYYSKPPGIAWLIRLGTLFFGDTELGVRFGALVAGTLLPLAVFGLAKACALLPRTAFWSGTVMAFSPIGLMASILAITDGGVVLFWTLACLVFAQAIEKQHSPNYWLLGLLVICGALFKWWMYYFWLVAIASMAFFPFLLSWRALGGMAFSLLGLAPSVLWNSKHQWVTFRHVFATIRGGGEGSTYAPSNFIGFVGEQVALLSPLLFILLMLGFYRLVRNRQYIPLAVQWCGWSCLIILTGFCAMSLFKKMQGNWCAFAYPMGIVFLCWYAFEGRDWKKYWLKGGLAVGVTLSAFALTIPTIQFSGLWPRYAIPYKINPFRHNVGWNALKDELAQAGYDPEDHFLFGDKYQTASILSFYGPEQKRAYFLNLHGARKNQFSFWPGMAEEQKGATGFFVATENAPQLHKNPEQWIESYQHLLQDYFGEVWFLGMKPLYYSYGKPVKAALIFKCVDYNGKEPPEIRLY